MFAVEWQPKALKQLRRIPEKDQERVVLAVRELRAWPQQAGDVAALQGRPGYRLRVGRYRVLFEVASRVRVILVEEVKKRDERTY